MVDGGYQMPTSPDAQPGPKPPTAPSLRERHERARQEPRLYSELAGSPKLSPDLVTPRRVPIGPRASEGDHVSIAILA